MGGGVSPHRSLYRYSNQTPFAAELIGTSRETCRACVGHFLEESSDRKAAFDDLLDNFMIPGHLQGGFSWYVGSAEARRAVIEERLPALPRIAIPTCVRRGEHDPILPM